MKFWGLFFEEFLYIKIIYSDILQQLMPWLWGCDWHLESELLVFYLLGEVLTLVLEQRDQLPVRVALLREVQLSSVVWPLGG